jgi:hypothetical protein
MVTLFWRDRYSIDTYHLGIGITPKCTVIKACATFESSGFSHLGWEKIKKAVDDNNGCPVQVDLSSPCNFFPRRIDGSD